MAPPREVPAAPPGTVRAATFNVALARAAAGALAESLATPDDPQARAVAEIIQRVRPDVLLLNEFDFDPDGTALRRFRRSYLERGWNGAEPVEYPYLFAKPPNTGEPSGFDLDGDGRIGGPGDAYGFGRFPGQYGMALLSRYPLNTDGARTFRRFRWKDMPGALLPTRPEDGAPWYDAAALEAVRLSSKSHWDVPLRIGGRRIHLLASHPTPPAFDGPEGRNVRRNHDEVRFWVDYLDPDRGGHLYDDGGVRGGLPPGRPFLILGDLNADPHDGAGLREAIRELLGHPRVDASLAPASAGAAEAGARNRCRWGGNGDPALHTADFDHPDLGNLRVDYVLPSRELRPVQAGVFWPRRGDPLSRLIGDYPFTSSDHRLVWMDVFLR